MSRNRLLTVFRSTETEKSSAATVPLPYPVIDFICFVLSALYLVLCNFCFVSRLYDKVPSTKYKAQKLNSYWKLPTLLRQRTATRKVCGTVRRGPAIPCGFLFR